jgi:hypothetical protein
MQSFRPFRRELAQTRREGTRDYREAMRRTGQVYGALGRELEPLSGQYASQMGDVRSNFSGDLAGLAGMLGSTVPGEPTGEISAGTGYFGAIGAGGLSELASAQGRNAAYNTSAMRQGSLEKGMAQRNYTQDLQDFRGDIRRERIDAARDMPGLIRQRVDELRDRGFDRSMALREFALRSKQAGMDMRMAMSDQRGQQAWSNFLMGLSPQEAARLGMGG